MRNLVHTLLTRWDSVLEYHSARLLTGLRISRISPNSPIFGSGYLRAQEELEADPTCFEKLKASSFELCKRDCRGVFAKIRKSSISTTTNRKMSFHTPNSIVDSSKRSANRAKFFRCRKTTKIVIIYDIIQGSVRFSGFWPLLLHPHLDHRYKRNP